MKAFYPSLLIVSYKVSIYFQYFYCFQLVDTLFLVSMRYTRLNPFSSSTVLAFQPSPFFGNFKSSSHF